MSAASNKMDIRIDDLSGSAVIALLNEHLTDMYRTSPVESVHALDVAGLKHPDITFFSGWIDNLLAGCIAIRRLNSYQAELKSMRVANGFRNKGIGALLLNHIFSFAKDSGFTTISLETGTQDYFEPARALYRKYGFQNCGPFSDYKHDTNSHFMTRKV